MLAAIGAIKGTPFTPDAHSREILDRAAKTAYKTSRVIRFGEVVGGLSYMPIETAAGPISSRMGGHQTHQTLNTSWV